MLASMSLSITLLMLSGNELRKINALLMNLFNKFFQWFRFENKTKIVLIELNNNSLEFEQNNIFFEFKVKQNDFTEIREFVFGL